MAAFSILLLLSSLLYTATAKALYPQTIQHPPSLLHDFQKNNVSTSWAPGHPKEWSDKEALTYEFSDGGPYRFTSGAIFATALSSDEKFLVTVNTSNHVSVIDFATGTQVFQRGLTSTYQGEYRAVRILASPTGYDVLVSMRYQEVQRLQLSPQAAQVGNITIYPGGGLFYEKGSPSVTHNERRFITTSPFVGKCNIYDLDNPDTRIVLNNQTDDMYDVSFTPDDKNVITRSYTYGTPSSAQMWDVSTGALVRTFNATEPEILSVSPDGRLLATSNSQVVQIWSLANSTAPPTTLNVPTKSNGAQRLSWSPDNAYLAVGLYNNLVIWKMDPTPQLIQWYQIDAASHDVSGLSWLSGSKRLAYRVFGGLEIYDFETNMKYRWGFPTNSHWIDGPYMTTSTIIAKGKGWIGGLDNDAKVRFWEVPA